MAKAARLADDKQVGVWAAARATLHLSAGCCCHMLTGSPCWCMQKVELQLAAAQEQLEAATRAASAAAALAEARLAEAGAGDREWGRRLTARDKEAAQQLQEAAVRIEALQEQSELPWRCCWPVGASACACLWQQLCHSLLAAAAAAVPGVSLGRALSEAQGQLNQSSLAASRKEQGLQDGWSVHLAQADAAWQQRLEGEAGPGARRQVGCRAAASLSRDGPARIRACRRAACCR